MTLLEGLEAGIAGQALNAAIWLNWHIGTPVKRSLIAYAEASR